MSRRGILYARLSRVKGEDVSIERQVEYGHAYFNSQPDTAHNCATDDFVEPAGARSGGSDVNRPRFRAMMQQIETLSDAVLWTYDLSRFTRGDDLMMLLLAMQKRSIEFVTYRDPVDIATTSGRLFTRIKGAFNAFYREDISDRQREALASLRAHGAWLGSAPQGLVGVDKKNNRHLEIRRDIYTAPDGTERTFLDTVIAFFKLYTQPEPAGYPQCCKRLNAAGYRWRDKQGNAKLVYRENLDDIVSANYRGFVDDALLDAFEKRRKARALHRENGKRRAPDFKPTLLYRLLFCDYCGKRLTYQCSHRLYTFYAHYIGHCEFEGEVRDYKFDQQVWELPPIQVLLRMSDADKDLIAQAAFAKQTEEPAVDRRKVLEDELNRLEDLAISGLLRKEKFAERHEQIIAELASTPNELPRIQKTLADYRSELNDVALMLANLKEQNAWVANELMRSLFESIHVDVRAKRIVRYKVHDSVAAWVGA